MFKHLLIPTDGSAASERAIRQALQLARETGARVTGLHVIRPFHLFAYQVDLVEESRASYEANTHALARSLLDAVLRGAKELGVQADSRIVVAEHPYQAIIVTAGDAGCDLVVMASHGRRGMQALLLGSETQKVLTHSTVPVLVLR
ncbi:MAG: universal stress protein [Burkholderiales bacterium]|nr:universal stress protein [Burkholderiales bacterium]